MSYDDEVDATAVAVMMMGVFVVEHKAVTRMRDKRRKPTQKGALILAGALPVPSVPPMQ